MRILLYSLEEEQVVELDGKSPMLFKEMEFRYVFIGGDREHYRSYFIFHRTDSQYQGDRAQVRDRA